MAINWEKVRSQAARYGDEAVNSLIVSAAKATALLTIAIVGYEIFRPEILATRDQFAQAYHEMRCEGDLKRAEKFRVPYQIRDNNGTIFVRTLRQPEIESGREPVTLPPEQWSNEQSGDPVPRRLTCNLFDGKILDVFPLNNQ